MKRNETRYDTKTLTAMAMLTALAYAVMAVCKVIPKVGGFLSLDAIDAVIGIGGFLFGPVAAVLMIVVEAFIEAITLSTTGWYGFLMNVLSTTLLICPAVWLYRRRGGTSGAVMGLAVGVDFEGRRYDTGNLRGFLEATIDFALDHPTVGPWMRDFLKRRTQEL